MKVSTIILGIASAIYFGDITVASPAKKARPIVDLGYGLYEATINVRNWENLQFLQHSLCGPPVGRARFSAPTSPTVNRTVNNGQQLAICSQANPGWYGVAFYKLLGASQSTLEAQTAAISALNLSTITKPGPNESEDCLLLDDIVPQAIYNGRSPAPVLVWIHGGGYTAGSKTDYNPSGLLRRAQKNSGPGFIYVAINYRLGMFGFLSGPTFQEGGTANAGFHDQRRALEWIQANIHRFGGDPKKVTIVGESAGGGSVIHQITAYGGSKGKAPFQQGITQSAGWVPVADQNTQENSFKTALEYASQAANRPITTLDELRALPEYTLQLINQLIVAKSGYGTYTFAPGVDGDFVPLQPGLLLLHQQFHHDIKLLIGHNADEGQLFTDAFIKNETDFHNLATRFLPAATPAVISYIEKTLYPSVLDGSLGYKTEFDRASIFLSEAALNCNSQYLARAFKNKTYNYLFTVAPPLHGQDVPFTFFDDVTTVTNYGTTVNPAVAHQLQNYITNFVINGDPNKGAAVPKFPEYGSSRRVLNIDSNADGLVQTDSTPSGRCDWWQLGLYA